MPDGSLEQRLAGLAPDARSRVEAALKQSIESELANEAGSGGGPEAARPKVFSRGWVFSRMVVYAAEAEGLEGIQAMDDDSFGKFAERLSTLRALKSDPPG